MYWKQQVSNLKVRTYKKENSCSDTNNNNTPNNTICPLQTHAKTMYTVNIQIMHNWLPNKWFAWHRVLNNIRCTANYNNSNAHMAPYIVSVLTSTTPGHRRWAFIVELYYTVQYLRYLRTANQILWYYMHILYVYVHRWFCLKLTPFYYQQKTKLRIKFRPGSPRFCVRYVINDYNYYLLRISFRHLTDK